LLFFLIRLLAIRAPSGAGKCSAIENLELASLQSEVASPTVVEHAKRRRSAKSKSAGLALKPSVYIEVRDVGPNKSMIRTCQFTCQSAASNNGKLSSNGQNLNLAEARMICSIKLKH
jgi:hypothetical protein